MLKPLLTGLIAVTVALTAQGSRANGFYVSGALSAVQRETADQESSSVADPFGNEVISNGALIPFQEEARTHYRLGGEADVAAGYRFNLGGYGAVRTEAEFSFRDYGVDDVTVRSLPSSMSSTRYSADYEVERGRDQERYAETANAFYDLTHFAAFTPYIGAGVGYQEGIQRPGSRLRTYTIYNGGFIGGGTNQQQLVGSDSNDGTWLVEGGVSLPLTRHLSIVPAYRYSQAFAGHTPINIMRVALRYSF